MKKRFTPWLAGVSLIAASLALAEAPNISQARIDAMLQQIQLQMGAPSAEMPEAEREQLRQNVTRELQTVDILQAEALKAGLDKQPEVQAGLANAQAQFYAAAYVNHLRQSITVSDAEIRQTYDVLAREIKFLPIEFADRAAAEAGLARLKKGLAFEVLQKEINPQANADVWITPQQLPPQVAEIANLMRSGQITGDVVEIEGRAYLFKMAGARTNPNAPPFDTVKDQLREQAKQQKVEQTITDLLQANGIAPLQQPQPQAQ